MPYYPITAMYSLFRCRLTGTSSQKFQEYLTLCSLYGYSSNNLCVINILTVPSVSWWNQNMILANGRIFMESWEEEEEKKEVTEDTQSEAVKAFQKKKKKPLAERIAEKEAERIAAEKAEKEGVKELTPEEKLAEKLKIKKIQEESDLKLAKDAFGVMDAKSIDGMCPDTEEEFSTFRDALKSKITQFEKHKNYSAFIEKFIQDLLMDGNLEELRRVTTSLTTLFHERQRQQKEQEKKKKKKTKTAIRAERDHDYTDIAAAARAEDFYEDDFI